MNNGDTPSAALKSWRVGLGLSQSEAADKVGVTGPTWHEWESGGRNPLGGYREALQILTGIPAESWMPQRERDAITAARAAVADGAVARDGIGGVTEGAA